MILRENYVQVLILYFNMLIGKRRKDAQIVASKLIHNRLYTLTSDNL